jgi:hypothetical protein
MAEVQAQRTVAEARLRQGSGRQRMTAEELTRVVSSLRDLMSVLTAADPADKAQIYSQLGLALTYHPGSQTVRAEARPLPMYVRKCPRGDRPRIPTLLYVLQRRSRSTADGRTVCALTCRNAACRLGQTAGPESPQGQNQA